MLKALTLRGPVASLSWGCSEAADLRSWVVRKHERGAWTLRARVERVDTYRLAQVPLLFTAPRAVKPVGLWCFPVVPKTVKVQGRALTATLGPPEGR